MDFLVTEGESHVTRARNNLVATFLNQTDAKTLVFIDADIEMQAEDFFALLDMSGVRGAAVACKTPDRSEVLSIWVDGERPKRAEMPAEPFSVDFLGSAVLAIDRDVFERLKPHVAAYDDPIVGPGHAFFWDGVVDGNFETEDHGFCITCREHGIPITCAPTIIVRHFGAAFWQF